MRRSGVLVSIAAVAFACSAPSALYRSERTARTSQGIASPTRPIEGYSNKLSVEPGGAISFWTHVPVSGGGPGIFKYQFLRWGDAGTTPDSEEMKMSEVLEGSGGVRSYASTAAVDGAGWDVETPDIDFTIPSEWPSGYYSCRIAYDSHFFDIVFVVKPTSTTRNSIMLIASTNTWTAYNFWPYETGANPLSIYSSCSVDPNSGSSKSSLVSWLRPNPNASPLRKDYECQYSSSGTPRPIGQFYNRTEHLVAGELRIAQWLALRSHPYSVITDLDLNDAWASATTNDTSILDPAVSPTLIVSTHSEYWSEEMRDVVTTYLRSGGNVMSLSGNTMFHQVILSSAATLETVNPVLYDWDLHTAISTGDVTDGAANAQTSLLGVSGTNVDGGPGACRSYSTSYGNSSHWALADLSQPIGALGADGVIAHTIADGQPFTGDRTFCNGQSTGYAAGWEWDTNRDSTNAIIKPGFKRSYSTVARAGTGRTASMVYMHRASAGQVFSVGSIIFGQALLYDAFETTPLLSPLIDRVLTRFSALSFSDLDSDGKPDLIARDGSGNLKWYGGTGSGGFVQNGGTTISGSWSGYDRIVSIGDFDGNGTSDMLARNSSTGELYFFSNQGVASISTSGTSVYSGHNFSGYSQLVPVGDFDGDGNPDMLALDNSGNLHLYRGTGAGTFYSDGGPTIDTSWSGILIPVGDFDGNGTADLLRYYLAGGYYALKLYRGTGTGGFVQDGGTTLSSNLPGYNMFVAVGDFSGDGKPDFIGRKTNGTLDLFRGNAAGGISGTTTGIDSGWGSFSALQGVW